MKEDPTNYEYLWKQVRNEYADMCDRCASEIENLRRRVEILTPKAQAYDDMSQLLGLLPRPQQVFSEDLSWRLRNTANTLRSAGEGQANPEVDPE